MAPIEARLRENLGAIVFKSFFVPLIGLGKFPAKGHPKVVWIGVEPIGDRDGRVALYLAEHLEKLLPPTQEIRPDLHLDPREMKIIEFLSTRGASFFGPLHEAAGGGYPAETVRALWNFAWRGFVTNDTFHALRAFTRPRAARDSPARSPRARRHQASAFRSRRLAPPSAEGRWTLVRTAPSTKDATRWSAAVAQRIGAKNVFEFRHDGNRAAFAKQHRLAAKR